MSIDGTLPNDEDNGQTYVNAVKAEVEAVIDRAPFLLTNIGGTGSAITADKPPQLRGSIAPGMTFYLTPEETNPGAATINIGGLGAINLVSDSGGALPANVLTAGTTRMMQFDGTNMRVFGVNVAVSLQGKTVFDVLSDGTNTFTWFKPDGLSANSYVEVELVGAGGTGSNDLDEDGHTEGGAGGGGERKKRRFLASELPSTINVVVAKATEVADNPSNPGDTIISSGGVDILRAKSGESANEQIGGRGADRFTNPGSNGGKRAADNDGAVNLTQSATPRNGGDGIGDAGAAGGDGHNASGEAAGNGGNAVYGGAGGGAFNGHLGGGINGVGGVSEYNGNGGNAGVAGETPGGGAGANAKGGNGRATFWIW